MEIEISRRLAHGGEVLALGHSTWIVLSDDQRVSFRAASPTS